MSSPPSSSRILPLASPSSPRRTLSQLETTGPMRSTRILSVSLSLRNKPEETSSCSSHSLRSRSVNTDDLRETALETESTLVSLLFPSPMLSAPRRRTDKMSVYLPIIHYSRLISALQADLVLNWKEDRILQSLDTGAFNNFFNVITNSIDVPFILHGVANGKSRRTRQFRFEV